MNYKKLKEFRDICQPVDKISTDPAVGKLLYRKLSHYFSFFFVRLGLSANIVSILGIFIAIMGISLFAIVPDIRLHVVGVVLLQISVFIDYADGEVARYRMYESVIGGKKENNISGAFMDNMGHYIVNPLALFFFGYRTIYHFPEWSAFILILGLLTAMAGQGIPNLVMSDIIVNYIQKKPAEMDNNRFRAIASGRINIIFNEANQISWTQKVLISIAQLYKNVDAISIISLEILIELFLFWLGYFEVAIYLGLGIFLSLCMLLTFNFIRTFRRNFLYLNRPF